MVLLDNQSASHAQRSAGQSSAREQEVSAQRGLRKLTFENCALLYLHSRAFTGRTKKDDRVSIEYWFSCI